MAGLAARTVGPPAALTWQPRPKAEAAGLVRCKTMSLASFRSTGRKIVA